MATKKGRSLHGLMSKMGYEASRGATYLKAWRKYRGLTQEQLAEKLETTHTSVGRIENGEYGYNQDYLERAALVLGCEVTDLLSLDPLKPDPPKLIYDRLRSAPQALQHQAIQILDALLKSA